MDAPASLEIPIAMPLVSVVVVNLDGGDRLREALDSLFAQSWPELEVILVDNGSSEKEVAEIRERYEGRLRLIPNPRNEGFARGNNLGMAECDTDWILTLNPDAFLDIYLHTTVAIYTFQG